MDDKSPEMFQYTGKYEREFPDWVHDIHVSYAPYKQAKLNADRQLGTSIAAGEIKEGYTAKYNQLFYDLILKVKKELPETIQYRKALKVTTMPINTSLGSVNLSANSDNLYYLPQTDEILKVKQCPEQAKYLPNSPEFIGWNALREATLGSEVLIVKVNHDPRQTLGWEKLSVNNMTTIISQVEDLLRGKSEMRYVEEFCATEQKLQQETRIVEAEAKEQLGFEIKRRTLNLVNTLSQYPSLFKHIPGIIEAGKKWEYNTERRTVAGEKQPYFRVKNRDLVLAPIKETRDWRGRVKQKPDFSQAVEATSEDWLNTRLLEFQLLRPIPRDYREFIEDHQGYEFRSKISKEGASK